MDLALDLTDRSVRSASLYRALRDALADGRLKAGDRLPASRALAKDLGISRNTVATVYERLVAEGFLESRVGAGTYVAESTPQPRNEATSGALRPRAGWRWTPRPTSGDGAVPAYDLRVGIPDAELFPFDTWRRILAAESRLRGHNPGAYPSPAGLPRLREALAHTVAYHRGVRADPDQIVVTSGTQQALDLVARVLLEPGDVVAVEDPGYASARDLFASHGARVVPVPVDEAGLVVADIPEQARLVYTTPSHQFPLGVRLSRSRRRELLAFAHTHGAGIVEDDYDSEFRFTERPLEPLHALDDQGRVIYVGTFSKSLLPSLRTGYLVAPGTLVDSLLAAKQLADGFGPVQPQAALARFLEEGLLARHVRKASKTYAARRSLLLETLATWPVEVLPSAAGLHLSAYADVPPDLRERAAADGLAVDTIAANRLLPGRDGLFLGYGAVRTETLPRGLELLARLAGWT
ncbi:GntR family transcriptional regulator/MocR family aminotransferase [Nocardioides luteus]|uniref:GntR family transcriptional regulator n=1 Tax=Nocardioides luteus TaxID=1844 RepID=A0ABQ5SUN0_9ACTN|nr:PLP-dependent aminotransferase family protein [Nocardioides luteus]MDR7311130.1 GntR family transcriptional regulator/MocR family aminotransferase [Nocardioides luteus]GGR62482.1 GntR family transcriptional regulator [Nocardioides luteus]GLJ66676.1 GntR family transcriptional regulator [Nocardioides luteus]